MRTLNSISSLVFLIAAAIAIWMHDPALSMACSAMSGLCRLDAQLEELKKEEEE